VGRDSTTNNFKRAPPTIEADCRVKINPRTLGGIENCHGRFCGVLRRKKFFAAQKSFRQEIVK
jgi:hypothetical protein